MQYVRPPWPLTLLVQLGSRNTLNLGNSHITPKFFDEFISTIRYAIASACPDRKRQR